jgi:hypothetical protein
VEIKRSYLDATTLHGLRLQQAYVRDRFKMPLLLLAKYIPPASGEWLAEVGINFADDAGNLHLAFGDDYRVLVIGRKDAKRPLAERRIGAGFLQVVFACLAESTSINSPVRRLAEIAGVSKTAAAEARQRLIETGVLIQSQTGLRISNREALEEQFVSNYPTLRSGIWLGAFRPAGHVKKAPLPSIREWAAANNAIWSATDPSYFYQTGRITIFMSNFPLDPEAELKLAAQEKGPITLLRSFGTLFPWRIQAGIPLAQPLLTYGELLREGDPKALEAAERIRAEYLAK